MNIPDLIFKNLVLSFWIKKLKFFDVDPDPRSCQPWIPDGKNRIRDPESEINIPDPQHWLKLKTDRISVIGIQTELRIRIYLVANRFLRIRAQIQVFYTLKLKNIIFNN
jgi:hypothetical protein